MAPPMRRCSYLKAERNYQMRDISRPDWDWVFLQKVEWDGTCFMATYMRKGGFGETVTVPAADFCREFRPMRDPHTGGYA